MGLDHKFQLEQRDKTYIYFKRKLEQTEGYKK